LILTSLLTKIRTCLSLLFIACIGMSESNAETYKVVTGNNYSPFTGENLPQGGIITHVVRLIFDDMGHEMIVSYLPWKEGYQSTKNKRFLATFPYNKNNERIKEFHYSDPIVSYSTFFFVHHDSKLVFNNYEDLRGLTYCQPQGYNLGKQKWLVNKGVLKHIVLPEMEDCLRQIVAGEADLVSMNPYVGWTTIKELFGNVEKFRAVEKPGDITSQYLIISKSNPDAEEFLLEFNRILSRLKKNGVVKNILKPYPQF